MKKTPLGSTRVLLRTSVIALGLLVGAHYPPIPYALATCNGEACTGLYADALGCTPTNTSDPSPLVTGGAKIERRRSNNCDADWARVTNVSGTAKYTAAGTRYGCANYCYAQQTQSGGDPPNSQPIGNNSYVYTRMKGNGAATPVRSCGVVSSSMISYPIGGGSPAGSSSCTGAW